MCKTPDGAVIRECLDVIEGLMKILCPNAYVHVRNHLYAATYELEPFLGQDDMNNYMQQSSAS
jgi:hypothetical protein